MKKRIYTALLALAMLLGMVCFPRSAAADNLGDQLKETQAKAAELKQQLKDAQAKEYDAVYQKNLLDERNNVLLSQIDVLTAQISETETQIEQTQAEEQEQYELFCRQVREEEERGTVSYWSVLFKATSFADLLSRLDFVNEVMDYDQSVIDSLRQTRETLSIHQEELETHKTELEATRTELEEEIAAATAVVQQYAADAAAAKKLYDEMEAQAAAIEKKIKEAEEAARLANLPGGAGGYIWPTNVTRLITSPIGYRSAASTNYVGTTNHKGVDIGAPWGSNILAAKAGVVTIASYGWNGGYGNYVAITHGSNSTYTLYAHMSTVLVSEGQTVTQGQVIGLVGSTGNSTGPHIHFEVHENGLLMNPLDYLPGYIRYDW